MLRVQLLGEFSVERNGTAVALPVAVARLLAYLALHPGAQDRDLLATRFWPDTPREAARANLRTALWALRRTVGNDAVVAARQSLVLGTDVRVDLSELKLRAAADEGQLVGGCEAELLPAVGDDWAGEAREEHRRWRIGVLAAAGDRAAERGDLVQAARCSRLRCRLDPFDEPAHAELLRRLGAAGDRAGALLAGREFAGRLRAEFGVRPGAAFQSAFMEVRAAHTADPVRRAAPRAPLFGRGSELASLMAAWTTARQGRGSVVVITGEAGIGKTRLVAEAATRATAVGGRVASGTGIDVGEPAPLTMWMDLARDLARAVPEPPGRSIWPTELGRLAPALAARLGRTATPAPVASPELERLRIFDAVLGLVDWAARNGPVLLVAEDVHRADRASLALCGHIARRMARLPVLLLLTRRDRPTRPEADELLTNAAACGVEVAEVHLGALGRDEVAAIVRSVTALPADDVARVVDAADGNPLLAVERARALVAGAVGLPATLRTAVRAALGGAPRAARDLLEALAVAARPLRPEEVQALGLGDPAVEEAAMNSGLLLHEGTGLRYRHSLLAEAARADLPSGSYRHQQLGLALETAAGPSADWVAAEVAGHLHRAGRDDLAGPRWRRAARHARSLGALDEAAAFWEQAIACDPEDPEPHLELAEVHAWRGRREDYEREWAAAISRVAPPDRAAAWCRRGAVMRAVLCHPSAGLEAYGRARDLLTERDPPLLRAQVFAGLAQLTAATDPDEVPGLLARAVVAGQRGDRQLLVDRHSARLLWLIRIGQIDEVEREAEVGAGVLRDAQRPDQAFAGLVSATCALAAAGRLAAALRTVERAVELTCSVPVLTLPCLAGRAHVLSRMDRHAAALDSSREALAVAVRLDSEELLGLARNDAGLVALAAGRHAEAAELLRLALTSTARFSRPASRLARAEALATGQLPDDAAGELRAAVLEPVGPGDQPWALVPRMTRVQGLIALARGDRHEAGRRLGEAAAGWRRMRPPDTGREFMASLVDLGRPPVVGLVDPAWELARVEAELARLTAEEDPCPASS